MSNQILISSGAKLRDLDDVIIGTDGVLTSLGFNVANGVPKLDENGKILVSQLPNSVMEFKGVWNAATNTPTLADGTGNAGDVYLCNVAGTVNFGSGPIAFAVGDYAVYTGTVWARSSGATGTVTSVGLSRSGDALTVTGSPITTSGTINIGFAGTNLQYINGAGNLVTFPTITTEAQRLITEVYNETGATLTKGTVVYINGGHGNLPTITKAIATGDATSAQTYGIVQNDIGNNNNGFVVVIGSLMDLDTQAYTEGTQLYLSSTTAGAYTSVKQYAPAHLVYVAIVTRSHPTQGVIEVRVQNGFEMDELHNVAAQNPDNNDILQYKTATSLWTKVAGTTSNIAEGSNLYFTDARARLAISLTTTGSTGAATYDNTTGVLNIPNYVDQYVGTVTSVGLSAPTGFSVSGSPVTSSGTLALAFASGYSLPTNASQTNWDTAYTNRITSATSPLNITSNVISISLSNTTTSGYLSSTDWNTFNGKQAGSTNLTSLAALTYASTSFVKMTAAGTFALDTNTYALASALGNYLPLAGGALTGPLTSSSNATFKHSGSFALRLDSASATEENDLRFAKNGVDFGAIQTNGTSGDFELYVNTDGTSSGFVRMINMLRNGTGTTFTGNISAGNLSGTNTGDQTLAGLGGVPTSRTLTINGTTYDLTANRSWTVTAGVTGSGTQNKLTKWNNAGGTTIGDSIISADANTATITSTVVGAMLILDNANVNGYSQMQFKGDTKDAYIFKGNSNYTSYGGPNALNFYTDTVSGGGFSFNPRASENAVFIDPLGNLGIGVGGTVSAKLDIAGGNARISSNQNGFGGIQSINPSTGTSAYSGITLGNNLTTVGGGFLLLGGNWPTSGAYTGDGIYMFSNRAGGLTIATEQVDSTIKIITGTTIKATMVANGNLGLNETAPTNLLHLAGNVATPSLRLASTSTGFYWDIGRENATTGDFVFNYKTPSTSSTEWVRITTLGLFGIGVTPSGTYGKLTVAGGIRTTADSLSKLEIGRYNAGNPDSYIKLGSTSNGLIISNSADSLDLFYLKNSGKFGIGISPTAVLDVQGSVGGALSYMRNNETVGYTGIDFFRQDGTHAGSVWCANDTAGATNNRKALTLAARTTGEKVIIVGGGYDPTVTGGLTITGPVAKLEGTNPHYHVNSTGGSYAYLWLNNQAGGTGNDRQAYFIQNTAGITANGVAAGAAYLYFGQTQNMEFVWGGTSRIQMTSAGNITATGFFDTSDARLKTLVQDNYLLSSIANVKAKLYIKNGQKELGYYAQDLQEILPSAVNEGADGFLSLSYAQVHTAKIAVIEDEVTILKNKVSDLEAKLQKYEA